MSGVKQILKWMSCIIVLIICYLHVGHAQMNVEQDSLSHQNHFNKTDFSNLHLDPSPAAQYDYNPPTRWWKIGAVTAAAFSTLGASYLYLQQTWWDEEAKTFHFDTGADLKYALNIDKLAHVYGGAIGTDMFYGALRWANLSEENAYVYGAVLSTLVQLGIEVKDGFAPRWGFSVYDVSSGALGSLLPIAKRYVPFVGNIDMKLSYYKPSQHYLKVVNTKGTWNDDYEAQTYWFSLKTRNVLPAYFEKYWPDFLCTAIGFSLDTHNNGHGGGYVEVLLGFDYDLTTFFPSNNAFWEGVKHYLNYIHLPAPAVRLSPSLIWFGLYF